MEHPLNQEAIAVWEKNAEFWDEQMGEGNEFHKTLIEPTQLQLLNIEPGHRILDVACGNGQFARKMASFGATVLAVDGSTQMIKRAKGRTKHDGHIEYRVMDCTNEAELNRLESGFDAAVCTMALMDIADLEPLAETLPRLLKRGGRFVFSVLHPCFNSGFSRHGIERYDEGNTVVTDCYVKMMRYIAPVTVKGIAMDGQPEIQFYFHRPLQELLKPFFHAGFMLDGLEEPTFPSTTNASVFRQVYSEIPPALVVRLRLVTGESAT